MKAPAPLLLLSFRPGSIPTTYYETQSFHIDDRTRYPLSLALAIGLIIARIFGRRGTVLTEPGGIYYFRFWKMVFRFRRTNASQAMPTAQ